LSQGQTVYTEGDTIDSFYFMTKGLASFSLPKYGNLICAVIDPEKSLEIDEMHMNTFQYFGMEDTIFNHSRLVKAEKVKKLDDILLQ
jgi:hypothetical protein